MIALGTKQSDAMTYMVMKVDDQGIKNKVNEIAASSGWKKGYIVDNYGGKILDSYRRSADEFIENVNTILVDIGGYQETVPLIKAESEKQKSGYIYIITDGEAVKIGQTKKPDARFGDIQVGNHRKIIVLQLIEVDDMNIAEDSLHYWYRKFWIRGEWFDLLPLFGLDRSDYIEYMLGNRDVIHEYSYSINLTDGRTSENMRKIWIRKPESCAI